MISTTYRGFFLQPSGTWHRRYEALRSYFVEQQPLAEVAQHHGVSYGTVCNWVSQFRAQCDAGERPPFFKSDCPDAPPPRQWTPRSPASKLPMSKRCR